MENQDIRSLILRDFSLLKINEALLTFHRDNIHLYYRSLHPEGTPPMRRGGYSSPERAVSALLDGVEALRRHCGEGWEIWLEIRATGLVVVKSVMTLRHGRATSIHRLWC